MDDEYYLKQTEILAQEMIAFVFADEKDEICCDDKLSDPVGRVTNSNFSEETDLNCSGYLGGSEGSTETDVHLGADIDDLAFDASPYSSTEYSSIKVSDIEASLAKSEIESAHFYDKMIVPPTTSAAISSPLRYNEQP